MKMQVGDIRMDSERGVAFGDDRDIARAASQREEQQRPVTIPQWAAGLAGIAATFLGFAAVLSALYFTAYLLLIPAALLFRAAAYATILAIRPQRRSTSNVDDVPTLVTHVREDESLTVEQLATRTGWDERRVLRALVNAKAAGRLEEDLDVETGEWRYARPTVFETTPRQTLPAEERLEAIQTHTEGAS